MTATSTPSGSTSARCPGAPCSCGSPTVPNSPAQSTLYGIRRDRRVARRHGVAAGLGVAGSGRLGGRAAPRRPRRACANPESMPTQVIGIGTDTTACTVLPCKRDGTPLCRCRSSAIVRTRGRSSGVTTPRSRRPTESTRSRAERGEPGCPRYGGRLSSEWELAKALQVLEEDAEVYAATELWVEFADWIVWQLCGEYTRNRCTAGYKGAYQDGRYPSAEFFGALHPDFADFAETRLDQALCRTRGTAAGRSPRRLRSGRDCPRASPSPSGNVDAHVTVPAAQAIEPGTMVAVMGTSTCHVMNGDVLAEVPGMCGVVEGGISSGPVRIRGRAERRRRHLRVVGARRLPAVARRAGYRRRIRRTIVLTASRAQQTSGAARPRRARLDERQPIDPGRSRALRRHRRADAGHAGPRMSIARCSRPLRSAPAASSRRSATPACRCATFTAAGGLTKNDFLMQIYADVTGYPSR